MNTSIVTRTGNKGVASGATDEQPVGSRLLRGVSGSRSRGQCSGSEDEAQQGGESSNTHLANRQAIRALETGGEDTLVVSLGVEWGASFEGLIGTLTQAKEEAQRRHDSLVVSFGQYAFLLHPAGASSGRGKGTHYAFVLERGGFVVKVSNQPVPAGQTPNVVVEVGSVELMRCGGVGEAFRDVQGVVASMGGRVLFDKVTRVDVCADLPGYSVGSFFDLFLAGQYVCRARKQSYHKDGNRKTGVDIGAGGDIMCRIYDKAYEVSRAHPDEVKERLLIERRWGRAVDKAVRVEFQLRRSGLKSLGVDSMEDYLLKRSSVVRYLFTRWLRVLESAPDKENNNSHRTEDHALWTRVCTAFEAWCGSSAHVAARSSVSAYKKPVHLVKQAVGCLMGAIATLRKGVGVSFFDFPGLAEICIQFMIREYGDRGFYERYESKAARALVMGSA